ncbi:MAG: glycosyltransferase family 9 protein [Bacteroidetes bacterium]|nr:MAG: glycosyltransferase family 9 protein [Bacteroidota bacterium]
MKVLLLRFSSIGDIVLTTPVIRCLKQQLGAEVHFLTKAGFATLLEPNPYLDKVYAFRKEVTEVLPDLRNERYDWIIDLHHNLRSLRVKLVLGRPSRSFDKLNLRKWLLVRFGINRLPDLHIVDRYLATVRHLGVENDGKGLDYFIPTSEEVNLSTLAPNLTPGKFVVLVTGANHATKQLPVGKIIEVCRQLWEPVVLLGGKQEAELGRLVAEQAGAHVLNCCGTLSLHQAASVVRQARKVITHDTGLMHVAAAFRKDIISIWGNTVPEFGMYPYYPEGVNRNKTIQVSGLSCRPCSKIGFRKCPRGHFRCMEILDPNIICREVK